MTEKINLSKEERAKNHEERLKKRRDEIDAQLKKIEAVANEKAKKIALNRSFIVGEAVIDHATNDKEFAEMLRDILKESVTKKRDRDAIADLINDSSIDKEQPITQEQSSSEKESSSSTSDVSDSSQDEENSTSKSVDTEAPIET